MHVNLPQIRDMDLSGIFLYNVTWKTELDLLFLMNLYMIIWHTLIFQNLESDSRANLNFL